MSDAIEHGGGHGTEHGDHGAHEHNTPYFLIFGTLVVFTVITVLASYWNMGSKAANVMLALGIATFKASLVMLFFMHLKYEKRPIVLIAMAPFILVAVLILALFPDIVFGQYH